MPTDNKTTENEPQMIIVHQVPIFAGLSSKLYNAYFVDLIFVVSQLYQIILRKRNNWTLKISRYNNTVVKLTYQQSIISWYTALGHPGGGGKR